METHLMNLYDNPFQKIKEGKKTVEMRLFDEKRKKIKIGDRIIFNNLETNEKIKVEITGIKTFMSFEELYNSYDKIAMGYSQNEKANPKDMEIYYSKEEQEKFGVCGIEIQLEEE